MNSFLSREELLACGFRHVGENVSVSRKASIYGAEHMTLGDYVRIDDFCILSGRVEIGCYVHIAAYTALYGSDSGVFIDDFANLSSRICVYAVSDDYSGETMTNPLIPDEYKNIQSEPVHIGRHAILGSGCTVLPGVTVGEGAAVGAMSLVKRSLEPFSQYAGIPCRKIKDRSRRLLELERRFLNDRG